MPEAETALVLSHSQAIGALCGADPYADEHRGSAEFALPAKPLEVRVVRIIVAAWSSWFCGFCQGGRYARVLFF
jgi:hypothetical protein